MRNKVWYVTREGMIMCCEDDLTWAAGEFDKSQRYSEPESLHYGHSTGTEQGIECCQSKGLLRVLDRSWSRFHLEKINRPRIENRGRAVCPSDVFQCKDGLVALAAGSDEAFQCLCQAMEKPELAEHEKFAALMYRIKDKNAAALLQIIREWTMTRTVAEIDQLGAQFGFASSPVLNAEAQ